MSESQLATLVQEIKRMLIGQRVYEARAGIGSMFTIDLGKPMTGVWKRGEWSIWVHFCAWRLELPNNVYLGCEDKKDDIETLIIRLEGNRLLDIALSSNTLDTTMYFEQTIVLRLFPTATENTRNGEGWMLFTPDLHVLAIGPGKNWEYEKSSLDKE